MIAWDDFRVVLAIAREGSLSGAARRLKVDQSTVSRRLAALESATQTQLFSRTPKGYVPTAAAEAVLVSIEHIEGSAIAVERALVGQDAQLEGRVRLATSDSLAAWYLVPRLHVLRAQHPGVSVELVTGTEPVNLARRDADVSLRMSKPAQPNLIARRLGRAAWAVYAAHTYIARRGAPDLALHLEGHDAVVLDDALQNTVGARWQRRCGERGHPVLASNSLLAHAAGIVAGLGVGPLPCLYGDTRLELSRLGTDTIGHHDLWLVVHPDVKKNSRVRAVMDAVANLIEGDGALLSGQRAPHARAGLAQRGRRTSAARPAHSQRKLRR